MRQWSVRMRLAVLCAAIMTVTFLLACAAMYIVSEQALRHEVDASLSTATLGVAVTPSTAPTNLAPAPSSTSNSIGSAGSLDLSNIECGAVNPVASTFYTMQMQLITAKGVVVCGSNLADDEVAVTPADIAVAANPSSPAVFRDATAKNGMPVRVRTASLGAGYATMIIRPLGEVNAMLSELRLVLVLISTGGVLLGLLGAGFLARRALRPARVMTEAAERTAATGDPNVQLTVRGKDELARLAVAFNAMTTALATSRKRQQQLIVDAGHELRTPVASLRTSIEVLLHSAEAGRPLTDARHRRLADAALGQIDELNTLISELNALARDDAARPAATFPLDEVVLRAVDRAQHRDPGRRFDITLEPWTTTGDEQGFERAVLNLLDNAVKFSTGPVSITLQRGRLAVSDTGPGLDSASRDHAFDRFWRDPHARELPGSGLGLALVADTVTTAGGTVFFDDAPQGGACVGFTVPETRSGPA